MNLAEIQNQLAISAVALQGLEREFQIGKVDRQIIEVEPAKLYLSLSKLLDETKILSLSGQVLGDFSTRPSSIVPMSASISNSPEPIPEISIEPVKTGEKKLMEGGPVQTVFSFRVESEGAESKIVGLDVVFDKDMWRYAQEILLLSAGYKVAEYSPVERSDFYELNNDFYRLHFHNLNIKIKKNRTRTLSIRVKLRESIPEETTIIIFLENRAVRINEPDGFTDFLPYEYGGPNGDFSKVFMTRNDE